MIEISITSKEDVEEIVPRFVYDSEVGLKDRLLDVMPNSATMRYKGSIIAIVGFTPLLPGSMEIWGVISNNIKECPKTFHKACRVVLESFIAQYKLRRVQMTVSGSFVTGCRWAKSLGFTPEGVLKAYGTDGSDYVMFGRVI